MNSVKNFSFSKKFYPGALGTLGPLEPLEPYPFVGFQNKKKSEENFTGGFYREMQCVLNVVHFVKISLIIL